MNKLQIVVFDLIGNAKEWLDNNADEDHMDLCEIITLDDDTPIPITDIMYYGNWDYLLVFEKGVRETVEVLLEKIGVPNKKIIYPLDFMGSLMRNYVVSNYIFGRCVRDLLLYLSARISGDEYALVTASGCSYINKSSDNTILLDMSLNKTNWAKKEMEFLYEYANENFIFKDEQDIFCDIGANIGTTCIYFKKKLDYNVKILAFEPDPVNYKMLYINAILNDISVTDNMFVPKGVSDETSETILHYNPENPGGSSIGHNDLGVDHKISLVKFDDYLDENSIDSSRIKYMWIDVEGHEARFLSGAEKALSRINAPVFMEFIPQFYKDREGEFELLIEELEKNFRSFLCVQQHDFGKQSITKLRDKQYDDGIEWDLLLLKE